MARRRRPHRRRRRRRLRPHGGGGGGGDRPLRCGGGGGGGGARRGVAGPHPTAGCPHYLLHGTLWRRERTPRWVWAQQDVLLTGGHPVRGGADIPIRK